jgi:oligopeptide/dipeptide ABC transporter ATP-binding protein
MPPGEIVSGSISLEGEDLLRASDARLRAVRGNEIAMIFQEPMTSLNPVFTVGDQIGEPLDVHRGLSPEDCRAEAERLLELVGIPDPRQRLDEYPHQLSGGMRQRVMIAMALACNPKLLIADEPTTALDVTVQAQILALLRGLQSELDMSIVLITHDLAVVAETARRVVVMYAGRVVEAASVGDLFERPRHPYTAGLFGSLPRLTEDGQPLNPISGTVPDAIAFPPGCRFHPRCPYAMPICSKETPPLVERPSKGPEPHVSACFYVDENPRADLLPGAVEKAKAP